MATIFIGLLILLTVMALLIAARPSQFRLERSALIHAPNSAIFPLIDDFHHWALWSPWEKLDPNLQKSFSGPTSGKGTQYAWRGNNKAGQGRMTIVDSQPSELVVIEIVFLKPFPATNVTTFKLTPEAGGTRVQWIMEGKNNFVAKAFSLLMNMDSLVGKDFEAGLASLNRAMQGRELVG